MAVQLDAYARSWGFANQIFGEAVKCAGDVALKITVPQLSDETRKFIIERTTQFCESNILPSCKDFQNNVLTPVFKKVIERN